MLPTDVWGRWAPQLELVELSAGQVVYEAGDRLTHVCFPTTAIVSLLHVLEDGSTAEVAVVGHEGVLGVPLFMGGESTLSHAVVATAGQGYRLLSHFVKPEFEQASVLRVMLRYTQALITQMSQTAVCNRHHTVEQQLCRRLLLSLDRLDGAVVQMTHESIANMLGVRREGVTQSALKLQRAGLIQYARGSINVVDRAGLEAMSCECYQVVKDEYDRLLPAPFPRTGHGHAPLHAAPERTPQLPQRACG